MWALAFEALKFVVGKFVADPKDKADAEKHIADLAIKAKEAEARSEEARAKEFADFIATTTPPAERVYVWANTYISLIRPTLAWGLPVSWMLWTDKWTQVLQAFGQLDMLGKLIIGSPLFIYVGGRELLRAFMTIAAAKVGSVVGNGSANRALEVIEEAAPPGIPSTKKPAPFTSGTGFKRGDAAEPEDRPGMN